MRSTKFVAAAAATAIAAFSLNSFSAQPAEANANDAIIAGAAGFAVGTLFGNATARPRYVAPRAVYVAPPRAVYVAPAPVYYMPAPWTPQWYSYCAGKYRSFDPRSGTYVGYDGLRHMCQ
jgi:hypothetical protein